MVPTHIFINGCSFLTYRPKDGVMTHAGLELQNLMGLRLAGAIGGGGRGNRRLSVTTKVWCEKNLELAQNSFFLIGITAGTRFDYPTNDGYKKYKFPDFETTWRTYTPQQVSPRVANFFKYLIQKNGFDIDVAMQIESLEATLNLQNFFKVNKYPYLMYNTISDTPITNEDIQALYNMVDKKRFFKPETSHYDFVVKENMTVSPLDPRPSADGHSHWAKQLFEYIDANNLRTVE